MRRVLLVLMLAVAAPVPKSLKKSTDYFPVVVGHTWVYAEGSWEEVVEVTKVVEEDGVTRATLAKSVRPGFGIGTKYVVNSEGVWRVPPAGSDFDSLHELQFPLKAGASWAHNGSKSRSLVHNWRSRSSDCPHPETVRYSVSP